MSPPAHVLEPCETCLPGFSHGTNPERGPPRDVSYSCPSIIFVVKPIAIATWKIWQPHYSSQKKFPFPHGLVASVSLLTGRRRCLLCGHTLPRLTSHTTFGRTLRNTVMLFWVHQRWRIRKAPLFCLLGRMGSFNASPCSNSIFWKQDTLPLSCRIQHHPSWLLTAATTINPAAGAQQYFGGWLKSYLYTKIWVQ